MASLLRRLRSWPPSLGLADSKDDSAADGMFLVRIIAFGEVFAVPVCKRTPVTVVLRHVMEVAVTEEQAAELGNVKATLYYKDTPLQLDATMKNIPHNAVLHLHLSVSTTSLIIRNRRHGAVSMLSDSHRRDVNTTVTMQPCLQSKRVAGSGCEGSGTPSSNRLSSGSAGLSSEVSPNTERQESPGVARLGSNSDPASSAYHTMGLRGMATLPLMPFAPVTAAAGVDLAGEARYYYFVPCARAAMRTPIQLLSTQSRRCNSAVEFANNCRAPLVAVNPLDTAAIAAADPLLVSPLPSPPNATAIAAIDRFTETNDRYLFVYLRLPRDKASSCMSAAALNADRHILAESVEVDKVPAEALLDTTVSTVATTKSCAINAYAYRRLRVLRDFPVGTLRELFAVTAEHRLYVAHVEVEDERRTFHEMHVAPNTVFYFKRRVEGDSNVGMDQGGPQRSLTRERLCEHLAATAAVPQPLERATDDRSTERCANPRCIESVRPSEDRPFLPAPASVPSGTVPTSCTHSSSQSSANRCTTSSPLSVQGSMTAFHDGAAHNPNCDAEPSVCVEDDSTEAAAVTSPKPRYVVEGCEPTLSSAMAAEEAQRAAELAALRAEAETTAHQQSSQQCHRSTDHDGSLASILPNEIEAAGSEESCMDVDCCLADEGGEAAATTHTATRRDAASEAASVPEVTFPTAVAPPVVDAAPSQQTTRKAYRLHCCSPTAEEAEKADRGALHSEEEVKPKAACAIASTHSPGARRGSNLVAKMHALLRHRPKSTPVSEALTLPHHASEGPQPLSSTEVQQPTMDASEGPQPLSATEVQQPTMDASEGPQPLSATEVQQLTTDASEPLDTFAAPTDRVPLCAHQSGDEATDSKPKRRPSKESKNEPEAGMGETQASNDFPAVSRSISTGPSAAKTKVSHGDSFFHSLRRTPSSQHKANDAIKSSLPSKEAPITVSPAAASLLTPSTSEEVLMASRRDPAYLGSTETSKEAAEANQSTTTAWTPLPAARAGATAGSAEQEKTEMGDAPGQSKVGPENANTSRGSGVSYSQRKRHASMSALCQPVAFLGSDPREEDSTPLPAETAQVAEDISRTLEPAVLSSTRIPTPRDAHIPVSILVSTTKGRRSGRQSNNCTPESCSPEHVNEAPSQSQHKEESSPPGYSVESPSNAHRLRITLRDPEDFTRFHYGVPVEPDCPVGVLREWLAAIPPQSSAAGEGTPNLCDKKRYGIFLGDTHLPEEDSITFAEVTCGRNDNVFSIRPL
ncbi:hypothetical protein, conserved [Leishmania tarentolae]|uniref:Ubiquitin-like domain-containing protein n=1 Tax=Leishmania tarentolae TaxID=5689 RepID=A0A640KF25_LEITA|nr:hypothetical protein, conserved [Leishmania tarentolae]